MNELEMIKAFAELEGVEFTDNVGNDSKKGYLWASIYDNDCYGWYNPITDLALLAKAMFKYEVDFSRDRHYESQEVFVNISIGDGEPEWVSEKGDIPRAVIKCILKSEGEL